MTERTPSQRGKHSKRKGYGFERETVNLLRDYGLEAQRVPLSGAGLEKGDLTVRAGFGPVYRGECKRRAALPVWIENALGENDFMAMRADKGETLIVVRLPFFAELLQ